MESMTNIAAAPPQVASIPSALPDNSTAINDDDAMEVTETVSQKAKALHTKRSRSMTPSLLQPIKSRRLDFNAVDPDDMSQSAAQPTITDDITENIVSTEPKADLDAFVMRQYDRFLYVSQFKPDTSSEKIRNFVIGKLKCSAELILCQKLISSKRDSSLPLSFVSFKIGTSKNLAKKILKKDFWPAGLVCKEFEDRSKNDNLAQKNNSRIPKQPINARIQDNRLPLQPQPTYHQQRFNKTLVQPTRINNNHRQQQQVADRRRQHQNNTSMTWRVSRK